MKRLFIGLPLSAEAEEQIGEILKKLQKKKWKVRWEPKEKWHVTLVFLGTVPIKPVNLALQKINQPSFLLKFKGLGRFPEIKRMPRFGERVRGRNVKRVRLYPKDEILLPKLIYVGMKGDLQILHQLQEKISLDLKHQRVEFDEKVFRPHLTIGKISKECSRGERLEIAKEIEKMRHLSIEGEWQVERVLLYESTLKPEGSVYRVISEVKLVNETKRI